jgi:hypothetical protein
VGREGDEGKAAVVHELQHLGDDEQLHGLPNADAPHAEGALRVVAEGHVLAQRQGRLRVERLLDVHARGVHLVVEAEAAVPLDADLLQRQHHQSVAHEDHLPVLLVQEHYPLEHRPASASFFSIPVTATV